VTNGAGRWVPHVLLLLTACGGKSSRDVAQRCGPRHDLHQAEAAFLQANCDMLVRCGFYTDASACAESGDRVPPIFDYAASGCVAVDPEGLLRCADLLREVDCRLEGLDGYFAATETCLAAIQGTLESGADCAHDFECVSGACETAPCGKACCMGTCASRDLPEGSSCASDAECAAATYCADSEKLCTRSRPAGAPCSSARECEEHLGCRSGVCQLSAGEGEPCATGFFACDAFRDRCDELLARCVPASILGEPCSGPALNGDCVGTAWCDQGTCRPLPSAGEPCVQGRCLGSYLCDMESMMCEPPAAPHETCR
jgi:hypothetical protein